MYGTCHVLESFWQAIPIGLEAIAIGNKEKEKEARSFLITIITAMAGKSSTSGPSHGPFSIVFPVGFLLALTWLPSSSLGLDLQIFGCHSLRD